MGEVLPYKLGLDAPSQATCTVSCSA